MLRAALSLVLALGLTSLVTGSASAADDLVDRESRHWTWQAPQDWQVVSTSSTYLWLQGRTVPNGGAFAGVERISNDQVCASGDSWSVRVKRFFRQHRRALRSRGWRIVEAGAIFHPKGTPPRYRRQRLTVAAGDRGIEVVDYGYVGRQDGSFVCHREVRYRETGPGHTPAGRRLIRHVLSSIEHK